MVIPAGAAWHALGWPLCDQPRDAFFLSDRNVDELLLTAMDNAAASVCVPSPLVGHAARVLGVMDTTPGGGPLLATAVGWPSGQHPGLVTAAEARLAVASGASRVYAVPDPRYRDDGNALVSFLMTLREAVPAPAELGVYATGAYCRSPEYLGILVSAAGAVGADMVLVDGPRSDCSAASEIPAVGGRSGPSQLGTELPVMRLESTLELGDAHDPQRPPFKVRTYTTAPQ